jgi:hypothetical protein
MNVWAARVVVRERGVAEIVDLAVRFSLVLGAGLYARLFAYLVLPAYALCWFLLWHGVADVWVWALAVVLFSVLQLPFTVAAGRLMFSAELTLREVLSASARLALRALVARFLAALLICGGALLVVLAPIAIARALYMGEVVVLEGSAPVAAYRRATRLAFRRVGQLFGVWLALVATSAAFIAVTEILARSLAAEGLALDAWSELWSGLSSQAGIAGLFLSLPLVATLRFLAYIDNRTRREGWDIQVRFLELGRALEASST